MATPKYLDLKIKTSYISMEMWIKIKHEGATIVKLLFVPYTVLDAFLPLCNAQAPVNVSLARSPYKSVKANRLNSILIPNINHATCAPMSFLQDLQVAWGQTYRGFALSLTRTLWFKAGLGCKHLPKQCVTARKETHNI